MTWRSLTSTRGQGLRNVATASLADSSVTAGADDLDSFWLPPLDPTAKDASPTTDGNVTVLPLFPLSSVAEYSPNSTHQLSIFEPRYRAMYNDILLSGSRRFVVADLHLSSDGERVARQGVVFYLEDLRDISEETHDEVKYLCDHRVIGRVRLHRILNPARWEDASSYLRVETTPVQDIDEGHETVRDLYKEVMAELGEVCSLQKQLEMAQLPPAVGHYINASHADEGTPWSLLLLWSNYYDHLLKERGNQLNADMAERYDPGALGMDSEDGLLLFVGEDDDYVDDDEDFGGGFEDIDADDGDNEYSMEQVFLDDLPPEMRAVVSELDRQYTDYAESLEEDLNTLVQSFLASTSHRQRLDLLKSTFGGERARLAAIKAVRGAVGTAIADAPAEA